jgi:NTP pyrophosphatase (non-canonical NTP hydrolase)
MIEECAELIVALQKRKRMLKENGTADKVCIDNIRAELADVIIMSAQLTKMLGSDNQDMMIDKKGIKMVKLINTGKR